MKYNDIMPECFIDTTLVGSLLDAKVSHKHSCNEVVREMEKGIYKDGFAVGIIDNDKRLLSYTKEFEEIGRTENLTFLKHRQKHQYLIKVGKEHQAMETFLMANVEAIGMKMEDFNLPSNMDELIKTTKNSVSTQNDLRILKLSKAIRKSPEVAKLKECLSYLAVNRYDADIEKLKEIIGE